MEDILLYSSLSVLVVLLALKPCLRSRTKSKHLPPSPPSLPVLGHLHLVKKPLHRTFQSLSLKYGPIFSLRFGSRLVVIVSSPSVVEKCFTKNDIVLANRPSSLASKHLGYNRTIMSVAPYGVHWRNLRRISTLEIFSTNRLNMFLGIRRDEIKHLIWNLSPNLGQDFAKVELKSMFSELTFNIIMRMVAGKRYYGFGEFVKDEEEARQFREIIKEAFANAGMSNPGECVPLLRWIDPGGLEKRLMGLGKKIDAFLEGLIDEKRNSQEKGNTMIDHLLSLQTSQPDYYTDQIIKGLILEKLMDESDISKLHYLQNLISETFRLYPASPLLVPHMASEDCTIGGYDVPSKIIVLVNAWAIHRDPELWDDATSFKPERFERGEGDAHKLVPFGIGRRACPGAGLAQRTISLALGSLIQCFEWERVNEAKVDMAEGNGLTMPKAVPLEDMCRARPIMNKVLSESVDV